MFVKKGKPVRNILRPSSNMLGPCVKYSNKPVFQNLIQTQDPFNVETEINIPYSSVLASYDNDNKYIKLEANESISVLCSKVSAKNQQISWIMPAGSNSTPIVGFSKYNKPAYSKGNNKIIQFYMYASNRDVIYCQNGADAVSLCSQKGLSKLAPGKAHIFTLVLYEDTVSYYVDSQLWCQARVPAQGFYYVMITTPPYDSTLSKGFVGCDKLYNFKHLIYSPFPAMLNRYNDMFASDFSGNIDLLQEGQGNLLSINDGSPIAVSAYENQNMRYNQMVAYNPYRYATYSFTYKKGVSRYKNGCSEFAIYKDSYPSIVYLYTSRSSGYFTIKVERERDGVITSKSSTIYHSDNSYSSPYKLDFNTLFGQLVKSRDVYRLYVSSGYSPNFTLYLSYNSGSTISYTSYTINSAGLITSYVVKYGSLTLDSVIYGLICTDAGYVSSSDEKLKLYISKDPIQIKHLDSKEYYYVDTSTTYEIIYVTSTNSEGLPEEETTYRIPTLRKYTKSTYGSNTNVLIHRGANYTELVLPDGDIDSLYSEYNIALQDFQSIYNSYQPVYDTYVSARSEYNSAVSNYNSAVNNVNSAYSNLQNAWNKWTPTIEKQFLANAVWNAIGNWYNSYSSQISGKIDVSINRSTCTAHNISSATMTGGVIGRTEVTVIDTISASVTKPSSFSNQRVIEIYNMAYMIKNKTTYQPEVVMSPSSQYTAFCNAMQEWSNARYISGSSAASNESSAYDTYSSALSTYNTANNNYNSASSRLDTAKSDLRSATSNMSISSSTASQLQQASDRINTGVYGSEGYNYYYFAEAYKQAVMNNYDVYHNNQVSVLASTYVNNEDTINIKILPNLTDTTDITESENCCAIIDVNAENIYTYNYKTVSTSRLALATWEGSMLSDMCYQPVFDSPVNANMEWQANIYDNYSAGSDSIFLKSPYNCYAQTYDYILRYKNNSKVTSSSKYTLNYFDKVVQRKSYKNAMVTFFITPLNSDEQSTNSISFSPSYFTEQHPLGNILLCQSNDIQNLMLQYAVSVNDGDIWITRITDGARTQTNITKVSIYDRVDIIWLKSSSTSSTNRLNVTFYLYVNGILKDTYTQSGFTVESNSLVYGINTLYVGDGFLGLRIKDLSFSNSDTLWDTKPLTPSSTYGGTLQTFSRILSGQFNHDGVYKNNYSADSNSSNGYCPGYMFMNTHSLLLKGFCKQEASNCSDLGFAILNNSTLGTTNDAFARPNNYLVSDDVDVIAVHELDTRVAQYSGVKVNDTMEIVKPTGVEQINYYAIGNRYRSKNINNIEMYSDKTSTSGLIQRIEPVVKNFYAGKVNGKCEFGLPTIPKSTYEYGPEIHISALKYAYNVQTVDCSGYHRFKKVNSTESWDSRAILDCGFIVDEDDNKGTDYTIKRTKVKKMEISCVFTTNSTGRCLIGLLPTLPTKDTINTGGFTENKDFLFSLYVPADTSAFYRENRDMSDERQLDSKPRYLGDRYGFEIEYVNDSYSTVKYFIDQNDVRTYYTPNRNSGKLTASNIIVGISLYSQGLACVDPKMKVIYR